MSNQYKFHCLDCKDTSHPFKSNNHQERYMIPWLQPDAIAAAVAIHKARTNVEQFPFLLAEYEPTPDMAWMAEHAEHHLVVMSEYDDHYYEPDGTLVDLKGWVTP